MSLSLVKKGIKGITGIFKPRLDGYNNECKNTLKKYGNVRIAWLTIRRYPIPSAFQKALEYVAGKLNFDKLFHLSLIATLEDGTMIIMEKNEVVNISDNFYHNVPDSEYFPVDLKQKYNMTIYEIAENARKAMGDKAYFDYEAFGNNCQVYIRSLLKYSGLLTKLNEDFLYQNLTQILSKTPKWAQKLAKFATTSAAVINKLTGGAKDDIFVDDLDKLTEDNELYRNIIYTSKNNKLQLGLMNIDSGHDIGGEKHDVIQLFYVISGKGTLEYKIGGKDKHKKIKKGFVIIVNSNVYHNIKNDGKNKLKLYTIYVPSNHIPNLKQNLKD